LICLRLGRILADHVQCRELTVLHCFKHVTQMQAPFGRNFYSQARSNFERSSWFSDAGKPGRRSGISTHIASTLHIVLSTERVKTRPVPSYVTCEQSEID
jgi:hypothetical protein